MSSTYVIRWKSKVNGRAGRGTKQFDRVEAERLAQELNREYPQIEHEVIKWPSRTARMRRRRKKIRPWRWPNDCERNREPQASGRAPLAARRLSSNSRVVDWQDKKPSQVPAPNPMP